jgi:hypothetical protein
MQDFQREIAIEREIDGLVNRAHAADPDGVEQQEITELERHNRKRATMLALHVGEARLSGQVEDHPASVAIDGIRHFAWRVHDLATLARVGKQQQQETR